jgi:hypothetical protein
MPTHLRALLFLALSLFLNSCAAPRSTPIRMPLDIAGTFPAANTIPGWEISQKVSYYTPENLFNLVDGQAESFLAYGFEQVAVQRYEDSEGILMNAEIWQLASPADAYGLFSTGRSGSPAAIGNEGDWESGRRLAFWQNRYFTSLNALQPVPDETLLAFAQAISGRLPTGGERPAIVERLPRAGLAEQEIIFFHEELSIQTEVWLGGANILGLSQETNGVVGRYPQGDEIVRLLLVEYPSSSQAARGLKSLQGGDVADLLAAQANGNLLGAVFGQVQAVQAYALLEEALK